MRKVIKKKEISIIGKKIWYIGSSKEGYPVYEGFILEDLQDQVKVEVINQHIRTSKDPIIQIVDKSILKYK